MANFSLKIDGVEAVSDVLAKVGPREARNLLRNTVHAVATEVRDDMRKRAPQDKGTLKKAIIAKREKPRGDEVASNVTITHGAGAKHDAYYWHMVEWGTVKMNAKPYITPAVEAMRPQISSVFNREFRNKYEQMMRRKLKAQK